MCDGMARELPGQAKYDRLREFPHFKTIFAHNDLARLCISPTRCPWTPRVGVNWPHAGHATCK